MFTSVNQIEKSIEIYTGKWYFDNKDLKTTCFFDQGFIENCMQGFKDWICPLQFMKNIKIAALYQTAKEENANRWENPYSVYTETFSL